MQATAGPIVVSTVLALVTLAVLYRAPRRRAVVAAAAMFALVWIVSFGLEARRRAINARIPVIEPQNIGQDVGLARFDRLRWLSVAARSDVANYDAKTKNSESTESSS